MTENEIDYEEIQNLLIKYHACQDKKEKQTILDIIVLTCIPVVKKVVFSIARRYSDPIDDIIQVGSIGLIKAICKYNPKYSNPKPYLFYSIFWEIKHYYRDKALQDGANYTTVELAIRTDNFNVDEINENVDITKTREIQKNKKIIEKRQVLSLDDFKFKDSNDKTFENDIFEIDDKYNTNYYDELNSNKLILEKAIKKLSKKQQELIKNIYYKGYSQEKLAIIWNTSQSNISRLNKKAIKLLSEIIQNEEYKD